MQNGRQLEFSILIYFGLLLNFVIGNLYNHVNLIDLVYLMVVVCCALKFFMIVNTSGE